MGPGLGSVFASSGQWDRDGRSVSPGNGTRPGVPLNVYTFVGNQICKHERMYIIFVLKGSYDTNEFYICTYTYMLSSRFHDFFMHYTLTDQFYQADQLLLFHVLSVL